MAEPGRLTRIAELIDVRELESELGEVLCLDKTLQGQEMPERAPQRRGKIVVKIAD